MYRLERKKNPISPKHSSEFFHLAIIGKTGSGKSQLLIKLLETEFFRQFNSIYLICPTFEKNTSYSSFSTDDKFYVLPGPIDSLEYSIQLAREEADKYFRSLIILDDIIGHTIMNNRTSQYVNLLIGGRHDGISTITISQQLTSISKPARDQFTRIISFYNPDSDDRKIMFNKYLCDVEKDEMKRAINFLRKKDYAYIDINILKGTYTLH